MSLDERASVASLAAARAAFRRQIESNRGRVIDMASDSVLAAQAEINPLADVEPEDRRMRFRIGVHLGDVKEKPDGTVYGDGVNIAANVVAQGEHAVTSQPGSPVKPILSAPAIDLSLRTKPSIAVLPLNHMSGDPAWSQCQLFSANPALGFDYVMQQRRASPNDQSAALIRDVTDAAAQSEVQREVIEALLRSVFCSLTPSLRTQTTKTLRQDLAHDYGARAAEHPSDAPGRSLRPRQRDPALAGGPYWPPPGA